MPDLFLFGIRRTSRHIAKSSLPSLSTADDRQELQSTTLQISFKTFVFAIRPRPATPRALRELGTAALPEFSQIAHTSPPRYRPHAYPDSSRPPALQRNRPTTPMNRAR